MIKRIVSIVLLVTMLMSFMVPGVYAAEDDGYIDNVVIENGNVPNELSNIVVVNEPETTNAQEETTAPVVETTAPSVVETTAPSVVETTAPVVEETTEPEVEETTVPVVDVEPVSLVPPCDCGNAGVEISVHSDGCAAKMFYKELCNGSAGDIYALWNILPQDGQAYIKLYLSWTNTKTLNNLELLIANNWDGEGEVATTSQNGNWFGAFGVPENSSLQVNNASADAQAAVDAFVAAQNDDATALFTWDISVMDGEGAAWQPDEYVQVVLEIPGERLHKHTPVYVVHVDDDGNVEKLSAWVTEDGKIAFNTNGFSTFAGYTVDFEYNGESFSIPGGAEILLSELMDQLKMPFDVSEVAEVEFSDYSLIEITREDSDWRLKSLQQFQTEETLTITMNNGNVYVIKVSDPISWPNADVGRDDNGNCTWQLYNGYYSGVNHIYSYPDFYYSDSYTGTTSSSIRTDDTNVNSRVVYIDDVGKTVITINPGKQGGHPKSTKLYINLAATYQIGYGSRDCDVVIQLGDFSGTGVTEVIFLARNNSTPLFHITSGSLTLKGTDDVKIVLDYGSSSPTNNYPLIYADEYAKNIVLENVVFRNSRNSGIGIKANEINTLSLTDCEFESTVNRVKINTYAPNPYGGAIHVWDYYGTTSVDVVNLYLERVKFNGNTAETYGGAIATYGRVFNVDIVDCDFLNCKAKGGNGGAIFTCGIIGTFDATSGTYFENCTATQHGGAVNFMSLKNSAGNYSTANDIKFTECEFKNCRSLDSYGGAISIASQTNKLEVLGCTFTDCKAYVDGGAISMYSVALSGKVATGTAAPGLAGSSINNEQYGTCNDFVYAWDQGNNQVIYRTTVDTFKVGDFTNASNETKHTTFTDCIAHVSGGGICIASGTYIKDADITNAVFNRCRATSNGNALMLVTSVVEDLDITGSTFENCTATKAKPLDKIYTFNKSWTLFRKATIPAGTEYYKINTNNTYVKNSNNAVITYTAPSDMEVYIRVKRDNPKEDHTDDDGKYLVGVETGVFSQAFATDAEGFYVQEYSTDNNGTMTYADGYTFVEELEASGTIRTTGATTCILDVTNCIVRRNVSKSNGGGLYWNANTPRSTVERCTVNVTGGEFYGNYAERDGGGIYCESTMTVSGTKIYDNEARCGGGIAQQVYSNSGRMIQEGEVTNLTLSPTAAGVNTEIYNNHARKNGGGVSVLANPTESLKADASGNIIKHKVIFTLNSAIIRDNTAYEHGGGVSYVALTDRDEIVGHYSGTYEELVAEVNSYDKSIQINNAQVYGNQSGMSKDKTTAKAGNGGGIYMVSSENTTLSINSGNVYSNTANYGDGGGIYITGKNAVVSMTGGTIGGGKNIGNKATRDYGVSTCGRGGGIALSGGATLNMKAAEGESTGGTISYNVADFQGGGIWIDNGTGSYNATTQTANYTLRNTMTLEKGDVEHNSVSDNKGPTSANGGGIYVGSFNKFTMTGGKICFNHARSWGGGLYAGQLSEVILGTEGNTSDGGYIQDNTGSQGAGICSQDGGIVTIYYNEMNRNIAANGGGAIMATSGQSYGCKITIYGGEISNNETTGGHGGGIRALTKTVLNMYGGKIQSNTAKENGGGIFAQDSTVNIEATGNTSPSISNNTAMNGGGVFVTDGADLTVKEGFIKENTAKGTPAITTTHLKDDAEIKGVGGGIAVVNGTETNRSTFTLTGSKIGIFGNIADFAADDVYSNGNHTDLSVPKVSEMTLTGYKGNAKSWVEDYAIADTAYESGTESVLNNNHFVNGNNDGKVSTDENVRYRGSDPDQVVLIPDTQLEAAVEKDDAFVCMTLGVPAAIDDVIVMDYSFNVKIEAHKNDLIINKFAGSGAIKGVGMNYTGERAVAKSEGYPSNFTTDATSDGICGKYRVYSSSGYVDYWLTSMVVDQEVVLTYVVEYDGYYYFGDITIIPATTIYYEDDNSAFTYKQIVWNKNAPKSDGKDGKAKNPVTTICNVNQMTANSNWAVVNNGKNPTGLDTYYQHTDRPGEDLGDALGRLDHDNLYGYDGGLAENSMYSWYSCRKFTSSLNNNVLTYGTVEFTFKGTGFDVISLTSQETGTITVQVTNTADATKQYNYIVDTYYGYNSDFEIAENTPDILYQVPVIKATRLPYGEYKVVLTISYNDFFDHMSSTGEGSYDFYLDSIRIYDPANDGAGNKVIQDAYVADSEGWPEYLELRNLLIKVGDFDTPNIDTVNGILFIDYKGNITERKVSDYTFYGPNSEVYLKPGQSLAFGFGLGATHSSQVASVQLGLRTVGASNSTNANGSVTIGNASTGVRVYGIEFSGTKETYALGGANTGKMISTSTDMYYDITDLLNKNIVISNVGGGGNVMLAVTNIKITYKNARTGNDIELGYFPTTQSTATTAINSINQYYASAEAPKSIDLVGATLSFEDEILTNLYYTTTSMDGVAEESMGLLTWSQMPEEVAVDAAENVYAGAVYVAESGRYMVQTDGIAAKELGDDIYMAVYAQMEDGSFIYSDVISYSPKRYAMSRLENSDNENLKALCVAMLNYGAEAQKYFGYKADSLMNADLTADQQALVADYDATLFTGAVAADPAKVGAFAATETGFSGKSASVSFEGAFALNFYFAPDREDAEITFCYWTKDAYESAEVLNIDNASGTVVMTADGNGVYHGQITGVAAKQLDDTYYVAAIYTVDGERFSTGVIAYSLSTYCMKNANSGMGELAQATAMYGYYAKTYFG